MTRLDVPPETPDDDPRLSALMTSRLIGITPDASAQVALDLMASTRVRHLPVLDDGACVGMVVESDVMLAAAQSGLLRPCAPLTVAALCRPAAMLRGHDRRSHAADHMCETGIDAVLIVEDGTLIGMVTATDLVRSLAGGESVHRPRQK
jgi:CBS domain-containing protein